MASSNDTLLDYQLLGEFNKSAKTIVYKVKRRKDNKIYALKSWNFLKAATNDQVSLISHETQALTCLNHEFLAEFFTHFKHKADAKRFTMCVFEAYELGDLETICRQEQGLRSEVIQFYTAELVTALEYIRDEGWVHRNVRPKHLLLDSRRHLKLCDYSCLLQTGETPETELSEDHRDIAYMSPEMTFNGAVTRGDDLWALGATIYALHTNAPAFPEPEDKDLDHWLENIRSANFDFLTPTSIVMRNIISALLAPQMNKRLGYGSFKEVQNHPFYSSIVDWEDLHMRTPPKIKYPFPPLLEGYYDLFEPGEDGTPHPPPPGIPSQSPRSRASTGLSSASEGSALDSSFGFTSSDDDDPWN